jgi:SSS family solute:Na+ symporter
MSSAMQQVAVAAGLYVAVVLVLGALATRRAMRSPTEYFLAGRALGTVVLFMALFGTNATSFVLVGIPGHAYTHGVGTFGLNAPIVALGIPLTFWAIGSPARRMAARLEALTPAELYARRFGTPWVGLVLFLFFTAYTLPYMVQAVVGIAVALQQASEGVIEPWQGGLGVMVVSLLYTSLGGMRATAWTNVFQGAVFLVFMVTAFFFISSSLGGFSAAAEAVRAHDPDLLRVTPEGLFEPRRWASWGMVISLTVIAFPHMFARLMAAENQAALRTTCRLYPLALVVLWVPAVLIGVWGAAAFPGLERPDAIMPLMASAHMPEVLAPFGLLAVLAAVMSTLDAQLLTLGSMLVRDVLDVVHPSRGARAEVFAGRSFMLLLAVIVYGLAQVWNESIFDISRKAFEGYTTLVPALFLGVRWRRFNAAGAVGSILVGNAVLGLGWAGVLPDLGFLPVFWAVVTAAVAGVGISLMTAPPGVQVTERAFGTVGS